MTLRFRGIGLLSLFFILTFSLQARSENNAIGETWQEKSVSVGEVSFYFNRECTVGRYANGDYWVLGSLTITAITHDL